MKGFSWMVLGLCTLLLFGCQPSLPSSNSNTEILIDPNTDPTSHETEELPTPLNLSTSPENRTIPLPGDLWYLQLAGEVDTTRDAQWYDIDLETTTIEEITLLHDRGKKVICYFSAGTWENYRGDAGDFPLSAIGEVLDEWPDESWLDIRDLEVRAIMERRLDFAVEKGCDGVDPDNMDGYLAETGFPLTATDQLKYNQWIANEAHERNLSVGLKNDLSQIEELEPFFDFAINEQCFFYEECDLLLPFIESGKAVFGVEYDLSPEEFCQLSKDMGMDFAFADRSLNGTFVPCIS